MIDQDKIQLDPALHRRWRMAQTTSAPVAPADAVTLAAYVDGMLDTDGVDAVETALTADPALLTAFLDLKRPVVPTIPSAVLIRNAQALRTESDVVVPFGRRVPQVGPWVAWSAIAASLALVSLVGFNLGIQTEQGLYPRPGHEATNDLLGQVEVEDALS